MNRRKASSIPFNQVSAKQTNPQQSPQPQKGTQAPAIQPSIKQTNPQQPQQFPLQPQKSTQRRRRAGSKAARGAQTEDDEQGGVTMATVDGDEGEVKRPKKPSEVAMENFALSVVRKKIEGLKAEFKEIQSYQPPDTATVAFNANKDKNRYQNVLCYDRTRVVLNYNVPPDSDYVHANVVDSNFVKLTNKYICTQGPTDASLDDFWRLVWQEKIRFIVMLCNVYENGKPKCAQYYPTALNEVRLFGTVSVTFKKNYTAPNEKIFETLQFEIAVEGQEAYQLKLMRWLNWPDFSVPQSGMGMLRILRAIRDQPNTAALIHCSAGIGRTGTLMACEICLRIMLEGRELNVVEVVKEIRAQRAGSIQTESQYIYLHRAICEYIHAKKLCKEELSTFFVAYANYRKTLLNPAEVQSPVVRPSNPTQGENPPFPMNNNNR